jgi:hypothetical protein
MPCPASEGAPIDTTPVHLAFSRLGADVAGQHNPLCATAKDGSLVLVCRSSGFSRPGAGVLRYSAKLSQLAARRSQIDTLRLGLDAATSGGTPVRLIIHTPASEGAASRIHLRADLVGSVSGYDGDAFSVDFVRPPEVKTEPPTRKGRRR